MTKYDYCMAISDNCMTIIKQRTYLKFGVFFYFLISRPLKSIKRINYQVFKLIIIHFYLQEILVNLLKPCIF